MHGAVTSDSSSSGIVTSGSLSDVDLRTRWHSALVALADGQALWVGDEGVCVPTPSHQVFLQLPFLDALDGVKPGATSLFLCNESKNGRIRWIAAVYTRRRGFYTEVCLPPFTPYSSVLAATAADARHLVATLSSRFAATRVHAPPLFHPIHAPDATWSHTDFATCFAPLDTESRIARSWSDNRRRTLKKHAAEFDVVEDPEQSDVLGGLVAESYGRHGRKPPWSPEKINALTRRALASGVCRLFTARTRKDVAAAVACLHHGPTAYYWIAGSRPGAAMTVLLASVLPQLYDSGIQSFDFVGANTPSIAEFKRRFGSVDVPYEAVSTVRAGGLRLLNDAKDAVRNLRRG